MGRWVGVTTSGERAGVPVRAWRRRLRHATPERAYIRGGSRTIRGRGSGRSAGGASPLRAGGPRASISSARDVASETTAQRAMPATGHPLDGAREGLAGARPSACRPTAASVRRRDEVIGGSRSHRTDAWREAYRWRHDRSSGLGSLRHEETRGADGAPRSALIAATGAERVSRELRPRFICEAASGASEMAARRQRRELRRAVVRSQRRARCETPRLEVERDWPAREAAPLLGTRPPGRGVETPGATGAAGRSGRRARPSARRSAGPSWAALAPPGAAGRPRAAASSTRSAGSAPTAARRGVAWRAHRMPSAAENGRHGAARPDGRGRDCAA